MSDNPFVSGDWIFTTIDHDASITHGQYYKVIDCDNGVVLFRDNDGDLRQRAHHRYELVRNHVNLSGGAEEYEEVMKGQKAWASIQKNSGN